MISLLKKHYLAFVLAFLIAIFTFVPQIVAIKSIGNDFVGIYPVKSGDELYYAARAQDILDGHNLLSNPYLFEYKDGQPMQFWLPDYLLTKPLSWLSLDVYQGYLLYDLVLSFILALLVYFVVYKFSKNKILSLISVLFLNVALFLNLFSRTPSPQFNFVFFLLLTWIFIAINQKQKKKYFIWGSLLFGFLFNIYTYFWTFYFIWLSVFLFFKKCQDRKFKLKPYLYLFLGALVLAIPYFVFWFKSVQLPYYDESIYRLGMIDSHFPSGFKIFILALLVLSLFVWVYKRKFVVFSTNSVFLLSGVLAGVIAVNQHLITGKNLEFSSHYWLPSIFTIWLLFIYIVNKYLRFSNSNKKRGLVYSLIFLFVFFIGYQPVVAEIKSSATFRPEQIKWQRYAPVFSWLNENTVKDSVVFANEDITLLLPSYTHNNVFYNRHANIHFMPDDDVYRRFLIHNYWHKIDQDFIYENQTSIWGVHYIDEFGHRASKNSLLSKIGISSEDQPLLPPEKIQEVIDLSKEVQAKSFSDNISDYKVDYLIWDAEQDIDWDFTGELLYQNNNIFVYKI
ncbi:hypothetical protein C4566_02570 [Candidatus Parcubacteria bacterium]|nr:MAG: hypothetical protein C4566_02570 [Candidatus Parcubacteria bacterium]